jgi:hypothetical protein
MEEMRTVAVDFDSRPFFLFAVGVSADVVAAVENNDLQAQLSGGLFCDCQAKEA